jgi:regulator of cell morphogenesis and NO signaling
VSTNAASQITLETRVGDVLRQYPQSAAIFTRFGIDTCCGQGRPIAEGARVAGANPERLLAELVRVAGISAS